MRLVHHQPFLLQAEDRLPDWAPAHFQGSGEVLLDQAGAGLDLAGEDRAADRIDDIVSQDAPGGWRKLEGIVAHRQLDTINEIQSPAFAGLGRRQDA